MVDVASLSGVRAAARSQGTPHTMDTHGQNPRQLTTGQNRAATNSARASCREPNSTEHRRCTDNTSQPKPTPQPAPPRHHAPKREHSHAPLGPVVVQGANVGGEVVHPVVVRRLVRELPIWQNAQPHSKQTRCAGCLATQDGCFAAQRRCDVPKGRLPSPLARPDRPTCATDPMAEAPPHPGSAPACFRRPHSQTPR